MVRLLSPLKKATTVLCDESRPTVSLIVPLKHMIEQSMAQCDEDSSTIAQMKRAILKDFTDRYQGEQNKFLQESTALDPRFRSLHQLNDSQREDVFDRLKLKATQMQNQSSRLHLVPCSPPVCPHWSAEGGTLQSDLEVFVCHMALPPSSYMTRFAVPLHAQAERETLQCLQPT
ncbi:hypothetical protein F7725_012087 [Dissostichus mawsoni]|uniref:Uncharacterized protein n=1 Tax=Dissostichus mawsoni TaxID=36200 RepID=A0A7J5ZAY9_DISMA|nr:hypothetical protein F7725_012087 [Dissostichus mawsoni]